MTDIKNDLKNIVFEPKNFLQFRENAFSKKLNKDKKVFGTLESTKETLKDNIQLALSLYDEVLLGFYLAKSRDDIIQIYRDVLLNLSKDQLSKVILKISSTNFDIELSAIREILDDRCKDVVKIYLGNVCDIGVDLSRLEQLRSTFQSAEISVANCSSSYLDKLEDRLDFVIPFTVQPVTNVVEALRHAENSKSSRIYNSRDLYIWGLRRFPKKFSEELSSKFSHVDNTINLVLGSNNVEHIKDNVKALELALELRFYFRVYE